MTHVLIAGVSTRAAAESAAVAGFDVTAIDAFGDLDQHPAVRVVTPAIDFTPRAAARTAQEIECDAVVYLANFENHPRAIEMLAEGRALWGNPPAAVRRVRNPVTLADTLLKQGFAAPIVHLKADAIDAAGRASSTWLIKPIASGGGQRIRVWQHDALPRGCYLHQFIDGQPGSVAFVGAGGLARAIGVSRQLVGDAAFGASGYQYCGSILGAAGDPQFARDEMLIDAAEALVRTVVQEFSLVGLGCIDFVARDGVPYAIEVNPRWSASMELVERAYQLSILGAHASACSQGTLPDFDLRRARRPAGASGKAVVFARRDVMVGDTSSWLAIGEGVRDIPRPGIRISEGAPVCTVFATGEDAAACYGALVDRAARVNAHLDAWYA